MDLGIERKRRPLAGDSGRVGGALAGSVALAVIALGAGCGAAPQRTASGGTPAYTVPETGTITTSFIPPGQQVRGDGEADNPSDIDGSGDSDSARVGGPDADEDAPVQSSYRFPDPDDRPLFAGRAPSVATRRTIEAVVRRYFQAASTADGAAACSLLESSLVRTVPEDNAGARDPAYVRGAKTCPEVLARLFAHYHGELADPASVFAVRYEASQERPEVRAIVASRTLRAGKVYLVRQAGAWKLIQLLSEPLP